MSVCWRICALCQWVDEIDHYFNENKSGSKTSLHRVQMFEPSVDKMMRNQNKVVIVVGKKGDCFLKCSTQQTPLHQP